MNLSYESNKGREEVSNSVYEEEANMKTVYKFIGIMGICYFAMKTSDYGGVFFDFMSATYGWYDIGGTDTSVRS